MKCAILSVVLAALAAAGAACAAQPQPAPAMGRLFYTPGERAQLDVARLQKKPPPQAEAQAPEPPPTPQVVTYGGIVRRSDGKSMLWINNRLVEEREALTGLNLKGKVRPDGAVTVQVPQTGGSIDVKVGQSVEVQTGRVGETRKPAPEQKPPAEEPAAAGQDAAKPAAAPPAAAAGKPAAEAPPPAAAASAPPKPDGAGVRLELGGRGDGAKR